MDYVLLSNVLDLLEKFEHQAGSEITVKHFSDWILANHHYGMENEPYWDGKENGRSVESVINTMIVHLNRYAKKFLKSAIYGSDFSTHEDFIYLINLKAFGQMSKMELIKQNIHDKPAGMQIIKRLIAQGWVDQTASDIDKRSKVLEITKSGLLALENQMDKVRQATEIVTGDLTQYEKMELIRLLNKLNDFHRPIYDKNIQTAHLIDTVLKSKN